MNSAPPDVQSDHQLLDRFACGDAAAFGALVERHGRMVFGVCRRVLGQTADAEDAYQATFLALIRQKGRVRPEMSVGGWLHTVATRIALQARRQRDSARLREREAAAVRMSLKPKSESGHETWEPAIDEALAGLPDEFRLPITLCDLLGRTGDEAAAELGCSRSTITRRLTEGREALRRKLERMGCIVPAAGLALWLDSAASAGEPSAAATSALLKVAAGAAPASAGISPAVIKLAGAATPAISPVAIAALSAIVVVALVGMLSWAGFVDGDGRGSGRPVAVAQADAPASRNDESRGGATPQADGSDLPARAVRKRAVVPSQPVQLPDAQLYGVWKGHDFHWTPADAALVRPVRFEVTVPAGHRFVTVAVDDERGRRVRNLLDAAEVAKFGGDPTSEKPQALAIEWNGLDDRGRPLPDGEYHVRGCSHPGMKCLYEYSFLNPGTPPWEHYSNSGWGGDHGFPHAIACLRGHGGGKWRVAVGGHTAEGGSPGFVLDADDRKVKAFGRGWSGPKAMAAADGQLWVALGGGKDILRLEYHTGRQIPFRTPQKQQPALTFDQDVWGIAVGEKRVAVLLHDEKQPAKERVVVFDRETGENRVELPLAPPGQRNGLACLADGWTVVVSTDAGLHQLDLAAKTLELKPFALEGIERTGPIAVDAEGRLYVMDRGSDFQVKVFSKERQLLRTIGTQGGQAERLEFDANALHGVEAMSVDDDGNLWVAEAGELDNPPGRGFVRRIAVWDRKGRFVKDFCGTTWYGANNTCLHEQDPTLALGYGVIYKLSPGEKPSYLPWKFVTSRQPDDAPIWHWTASPGVLFGSVRMFRSDVSGTMREYILQMNGFPILFQADERGEYRPIFSVGSHEHHKAFPKEKDEPKALFLWSDLNGDSRPQEDEFQRVPGSNYSVHFFGGTGFPPPRDLVWHIEGHTLKPARFTENGAPVYDVASSPRLASPGFFLPVGRHLVATVPGKWDSPEAGYFFAGNYHFADREGRTEATYRVNWPVVHASWKSTQYKPGQTGRTIGELFFAGSADSRGEIGHVLCPQGNQGQSFLLSEDGLFVGTLFKDYRQNPKGWGEKEEVGTDWSDITLMSECFGGWFGRQDDGVVRYMFGRNGCHVVRVEGLEEVRRFDAGWVELAGPPKGGRTPAAKLSSDRTLRVPNIRGLHPPFRVDGDPAEWKGIARREIRNGEDVAAKIAVAHSLEHLWILAEVVDPSPARNGGEDPKFVFKTGDALDIQLGPERPDLSNTIAGDVRILIAPGAKKPVAMIYRPVHPRAKPEEAVRFESPVKTHTFDSVISLSDAQADFRETPTGYVVEVRLSCDQIELKHAESGLTLRGDVGVLWSNESGLATERRSYLFNRGDAAGIVSDTPTEAEIHPREWGRWTLE